MAELFELPELVSYMQVPQLQTDIATLARQLATSEIRRFVGAARYDALDADDQADLKGVALQIAKRIIFNPEGMRSEQIDDYSYTISAEDLRPPQLAESEERRINRIIGRSPAHTIRPTYPTPEWRVDPLITY